VREALRIHGAPVWVRKQIVHNRHVVAELEEIGARFVDRVRDVPNGSVVVLSAHGVAPDVRRRAEQRSLTVIDATCPLVTKVHRQVVRFVESGHHVILVGHADHEEVVGTRGEAPEHVTVVESIDDVAHLNFSRADKLAWVTQTTLAVVETASIIRRLRDRFPNIVGPSRDDICYATTNRQKAVQELAHVCDAIIVVGSSNSSNSQRLVEVAMSAGTPAWLVEDESSIDGAWFDGAKIVGITSGASAPEVLVDRVCDWFRELGTEHITPMPLVEERMRFAMPDLQAR
jgi:4-hydroxy-3-methylbut-2-enyl diphosphate reductase